MDVHDVRVALRDVGVDANDITAVEGGWANWTFVVDGHLIVRFPRNAEVTEATRRELRLLPVLRDHVSFGVPVPCTVGEWAGRPFFGYELIPGRAFSDFDMSHAEMLEAMLAELHAFPVGVAAELLHTPPPRDAWRRHYEQLWQLVEQVALPELDRALADCVRREYAKVVERPPDFPTCFIHNDLGPEHVLVGPRNTLVGIIDFEDAWLGDPATDLTPFAARLGRGALAPLSAGRDLGDRLEDRVRFYRWMGSIHAIIYGVREHVEAERVAGIRELRRRLSTGNAHD